jgi:hypothetical protein
MKRFTLSAVVVAGFLVVSAVPASALRPDRFEPGPNPDTVVEGICDFPVLLHDVTNQLVITDFYDQNGDLVRETGSGQIVEQISRLDEDGEPVKSITRNISGPGTFTFDETGATLVATGAWLFFFTSGDLADHSDGLFWLTTGRWTWRVDDDGWTLVSYSGSYTDVCTLLT